MDIKKKLEMCEKIESEIPKWKNDEDVEGKVINLLRDNGFSSYRWWDRFGYGNGKWINNFGIKPEIRFGDDVDPWQKDTKYWIIVEFFHNYDMGNLPSLTEKKEYVRRITLTRRAYYFKNQEQYYVEKNWVLFENEEGK